MHAHIHRVLKDLDYDVILMLHLMCNLNDGRVILGLDLRRLESLRLVLEHEVPNCQAHVVLAMIIDSLKVVEFHQLGLDVTAALHVFHYQMVFATNLMLRLIDLMWLLYLALLKKEKKYLNATFVFILGLVN